MNNFFDTFKLILDDKNFRTTFLVHEDAFKTTAALYKYNELLKNILDDAYGLQRLSDKFMDMEISINKEYQSQSNAASTNPDPVVIPQPQVVSQSASSSSLKSTAKPFVSRTKSEKIKENFKGLGDDAIQILIGYHPNLSLGQYVHNILIYDVSAKWENITILDYLKTWVNIISVTVKKQQKYKTVWQDKPNKLNQNPLSKCIKVSSRSKIDFPVTGSNCVPIRSPQKDSSQSSSKNKTGEKNKQSQKTKNKSTSTSFQRSCQNDNYMLRL
ncbi:hypothetical protein RCL_jg14716.t1 [Rhizophagus clarus]|uniref:Uncharacterized protein n=1 Tax=Rhizophagus clarus TaxID=94130 RepID=A0A8H3M4Z0_9GLOM|nr:hypothetical protein RCL_jg14716.t1 [Rhizophagus clarus]